MSHVTSNSFKMIVELQMVEMLNGSFLEGKLSSSLSVVLGLTCYSDNNTFPFQFMQEKLEV